MTTINSETLHEREQIKKKGGKKTAETILIANTNSFIISEQVPNKTEKS